MSSHLLIQNGEVVTAEGSKTTDVWCDGEKIRQVAPGIPVPPGAEVWNASGKFVFPGFIDPHVHAYLPLKKFTVKSGYASTSRAALMGGTTCFFDFCGSGLEKDPLAAFDKWRAAAENQSACDYGWHMTVTRFDAGVARQLLKLAQRGIKTLKIYLAYKNTLSLPDGDLFALLKFAAQHDLLVLAHCENAELIDQLQKQLLAEGKTGPEWHYHSRPPIVEAEGVNRFLTFGALTQARCYIVHLSCEEALREALQLAGQMRELHIETMIHYLLLDKTAAEKKRFEGAKYVLSPPLRDKANQLLLWVALQRGVIETVGTDHCPFDFRGQKTLGKGNFANIPNGIGGVEERMGLLYTHGVLEGRLSLEEMVAAASANPAKIFNIYPRKGTIAAGSDADLVVYDPTPERVVSVKTQSIDTDYNPYEGFRIKGKPELVTVRGKIMVKKGKFVGPCDHGQRLES